MGPWIFWVFGLAWLGLAWPGLVWPGLGPWDAEKSQARRIAVLVVGDKSQGIRTVVFVVAEKSQARRIAVLVVGDKSQAIRTVVFVVAEWLLRSLRQYGVARHGPIQIYCDFTIGSHLVLAVLLDVNRDGPSWPRHAFCVYIQNSISIWLHRTKTSSTMIANSISKWFKQGCPPVLFA